MRGAVAGFGVELQMSLVPVALSETKCALGERQCTVQGPDI